MLQSGNIHIRSNVLAKKIHHIVRRPGKNNGDPDIEIPVAEDLVTQPGNPTRDVDVSFYGREYPLEAHFVENSADREWLWSQYTSEFSQWRIDHEKRDGPLVAAAAVSGDINPTVEAEPDLDYTDLIRRKARALGFNEVGFTRYDRRYTYASKKRWAKFPHAICLAYEQGYEGTQKIPSEEAEHVHFGTYAIEGQIALDLAAYIRTLGYHAQVHSHSDSSAPYIPMFVAAGLGQLGANGQLLMPHFGSRGRLMIITTDTPVRYDAPIDYGFNRFCETCQVCVNRCPSNALVRDKVWWRGALKNKVNYGRCRAVMGRYDGCSICMKVCPVQKFGMKPVMDHYVNTGTVLGKGTDDLEGFDLKDKGHFGPGQKPHFSPDFFEIPRGRFENWIFEKLKDQLADRDPNPEELRKFGDKVREALKVQRETTE